MKWEYAELEILACPEKSVRLTRMSGGLMLKNTTMSLPTDLPLFQARLVAVDVLVSSPAHPLPALPPPATATLLHLRILLTYLSQALCLMPRPRFCSRTHIPIQPRICGLWAYSSMPCSPVVSLFAIRSSPAFR